MPGEILEYRDPRDDVEKSFFRPVVAFVGGVAIVSVTLGEIAFVFAGRLIELWFAVFVAVAPPALAVVTQSFIYWKRKRDEYRLPAETSWNRHLLSGFFGCAAILWLMWVFRPGMGYQIAFLAVYPILHAQWAARPLYSKD